MVPWRQCPGRILIVDPDVEDRCKTVLTLSHEGYQVDEADDEASAFDRICAEHNLVFYESPQLATDGQEFLETMSKRFPGIAVAILTGNATVSAVVESFKRGVVDFLVKPALENELLEVVRRVVQSPPPFHRLVQRIH
jgi:DNA-binding NtrC family response regulator